MPPSWPKLLFPSNPWQPLTHFHLFGFVYSAHFIEMEAYNMWSFVSGFIMFSRFVHVVAWISTSFLFVTNNILLYRFTTFCLSTHLLMHIFIVSAFSLVWIMLLWTFVYRFLCEHMFLFLLHLCLGVEFLGRVVLKDRSQLLSPRPVLGSGPLSLPCPGPDPTLLSCWSR